VKVLGSIPDGLTIDLLEELLVLVPHLGGAGPSPLLAGVADRVRRGTVSCTTSATSASISTGTSTGTYTSISTRTGTTNTNGRGRGMITSTLPRRPKSSSRSSSIPSSSSPSRPIIRNSSLMVWPSSSSMAWRAGRTPGLRRVTTSRRPAKPREPSCRLGSKDPRSSPLRYPNGFASAEQLRREVKKIRTGERNQKN